MVVSAGIAAVSVCLIFLFRTIPSGSLWKGYRILYVPSDSDNAVVEKAISDAGCSDVIDLASQFIPLPLPADTPEVSLAESSASDNGYLSGRTSYFFDRNGKYRLYYIPDTQTVKIEAAAGKLSAAGIRAGMDTQTAYPWIIPVVCLLAAVLLCILSVRRAAFVCSAVIPLFFSLCMPFYTGAASVCLLLYALFLVQQVWGRKNAFGFVSTNVTILCFVLSSLGIAILTSLRCGLLFAAAVAGTAGVLFLVSRVELRHDGRYSFTPVMIRAAGSSLFRTRNVRRAAAVCAVLISVLGGILLVSSSFSGSPDQMELPAAHSGSITGGLPSLDDYVVWCWDARTMPYRSLHETEKESPSRKPKKGETVVFPQYTESDKGISAGSMTLQFDAAFRTKTLTQIDDLNFQSVEKLLKTQGTSSRTGYAFSVSGGGMMYFVLLIVSFFIPLFFFARSYLPGGRWSKNK